MRGFSGLVNETLKKRQGVLSEIQLLDSAAAKLDQFHAEAIAAVDGLADEPLAFQHDQEAMNRAFVETQMDRQLGRAELLRRTGHRIKDPEGAFEDLDPVSSWDHRSGILSDATP